jgi:hypothetical protein
MDAVGHDSPASRRRRTQVPEERPCTASVAREPEVVASDDHRVERSERRVDVRKSEHAGISHASSPRHLDGQGRLVDRDDVVPAVLEVEADASGATADVEHPPPHEAHHPPLCCGPAAEGGEVVAGISAVDDAVVALHDLVARPSLEDGEKDLAVRVLGRREPARRPPWHGASVAATQAGSAAIARSRPLRFAR